MHISIIINGSNDLYYPLKKSLNDMLHNICNGEVISSISIIYSLIKSENDFWKYVESDELEDEKGYLEYTNGKLRKKEYVFSTEDTSLDIDLAINESYKKGTKNVLIVSGHGGPFQCMLDMSNKIDKSFSTYEFCSVINKRAFEVVILDMCSMNFIEVLYEILYKCKINSVITYKGFAEFNGIDYLKIIDVLERNKVKKDIMTNFKYPFIYIDTKSLKCFEELKKIQDILVHKCIFLEKPDFSLELSQIKNLIDLSVCESDLAKRVNLSKLNYIKYFLEDERERIIYDKYLYTKNSLWKKFLFMDNQKELEIKYIKLANDSLRHIMQLHNPKISDVELNKMLSLYNKKKQE